MSRAKERPNQKQNHQRLSEQEYVILIKHHEGFLADVEYSLL
jgi:hypothetical protein